MKKPLIFCLLICTLFTNCEHETFIELKSTHQEASVNDLLQRVDNLFFDYNYASSSNFFIELAKSNKKSIDLSRKSSNELYSPFVSEIRTYLLGKGKIKNAIKKKLGFPLWDYVQ